MCPLLSSVSRPALAGPRTWVVFSHVSAATPPHTRCPPTTEPSRRGHSHLRAQQPLPPTPKQIAQTDLTALRRSPLPSTGALPWTLGCHVGGGQPELFVNTCRVEDLMAPLGGGTTVRWPRLSIMRPPGLPAVLGNTQRGLKSGNGFISAVAPRSWGISRKHTWGQSQKNIPWSPQHRSPSEQVGLAAFTPSPALEAPEREERESQEMQSICNCGRVAWSLGS